MLSMYSPKMNYLFAQGICAGLTASDGIVSSDFMNAVSSNYASVLNCTGDSATVVACMQGKTLAELGAANIAINADYLTWSLTIDNVLFTDHPQNLIDRARPKPMINSYAIHEWGALAYKYQYPGYIPFGIPAANYSTFTRALLRNKFLTMVTPAYGALASNVTDLLMDYYAVDPPGGPDTNTTYNLVAFGNFYQDLYYNNKLQESAILATVGWPDIWATQIDYYSPHQFPAGYPKLAAPHAQDENYIWLNGFGDPDDPAYCTIIRESWFGFIKTGSPVTAAVPWKRQTPAKPWRWMDLSLTPNMVNKYDHQRMKLWLKKLVDLVGTNYTEIGYVVRQITEKYLEVVVPPY